MPIDENLEIAKELLKLASDAKIILEIEIGVVGGEEDGVEAEINDKLYTTEDDYLKTIDALGAGDKGRYLLAATFGNVHGVYKPGNVKLRPEVLKRGQEVAAAKLGQPAGAKPTWNFSQVASSRPRDSTYARAALPAGDASCSR